MSARLLEILFVCIALKSDCCQLDHSSNQLKFLPRGPSLVAAVNLKCSQETLVTRKNTCGRKNTQAHLHGALGEWTKLIFFAVRQNDKRHHVTDLNVDSGAQSVQDPRERRAQRYQFKNLPLSHQLAAAMVIAMLIRPQLPWWPRRA